MGNEQTANLSDGIPEAQSILARFERVYATLPFEERKRPIVFIDNEPINWELAYREIKNNTKLGATIGKKLIDLQIV